MRKQRKQTGFSLTEVLLATGILAMGFVLIALIFPVGVKLTSMATEKTLAPAIGQEAQNIVRLYGLGPANPLLIRNPQTAPPAPTYSKLFSPEYLRNQSLRYFYRKMIPDTTVFDPLDPATYPLPAEESPEYQMLMDYINAQLAADSLYPSLPADYSRQHPQQRQRYCWTAVCRADPRSMREADVYVFACRRVAGARHYNFPYDPLTQTIGRDPADPADVDLNDTTDYTDRPVPIPVRIRTTAVPNQVEIDGTATQGPVYPLETSCRFFTEGSLVIDDQFQSPLLPPYQVLERLDTDGNGTFETLTLDRNYTGGSVIWVVPPPAGTGRNICIGVFIYRSV